MSSSCPTAWKKPEWPLFFKALGHPQRLSLIARLLACRKPCTVGEMNSCCPIDFSVVSRHLALLREGGILTCERKGKEVYYEINRNEVANKLRSLADSVAGCCSSKNQRNK